jgi:hypothetical protein
VLLGFGEEHKRADAERDDGEAISVMDAAGMLASSSLPRTMRTLSGSMTSWTSVPALAFCRDPPS